MALNSNALTTMVMAKTFLKIPQSETSQDVLIEHFINSASDYLEHETSRVLKLRSSLVEYHDGIASEVIITREWPIVSIGEIRLLSKSTNTPDEILTAEDYEITDDNTAILKMSGGTWNGGLRSIKVTYDAGYSQIPSDLENAALWLVFWYQKIRDAADIGRATKNKEGESVSYLQEAPQEVKNAIARYKRTEFPIGTRQSYNAADIL